MTLQRLSGVLWHAFAWLCLSSATVAYAQSAQLSISQAADRTISATLSVTYVTSCSLNFPPPAVSRSGNAISVLTQNLGTPCLPRPTVTRSFTFVAPLGTLPAGTYTLAWQYPTFTMVVGPDVTITTSFTVDAAGTLVLPLPEPVPATDAGVLAALSLLLGTLAFARLRSRP